MEIIKEIGQTARLCADDCMAVYECLRTHFQKGKGILPQIV